MTGGWSTPDICVHKGLPVTTPARTLIDLAAVVPELLEEALDEALRRKLLSLPRLESRLEQLGPRGRSGTAALQTLMTERWAESVLPHSLLERRFLKLIRREGLPPRVRQHPVTVDGETFHLDFAYLESRIAIEADSYTWHTDPEAWQRDLHRRSLFTVAGWTILHTTWRELEREPSVVVDRLGRLLRPRLLSGSGYEIRG